LKQDFDRSAELSIEMTPYRELAPGQPCPCVIAIYEEMRRRGVDVVVDEEFDLRCAHGEWDWHEVASAAPSPGVIVTKKFCDICETEIKPGFLAEVNVTARASDDKVGEIDRAIEHAEVCRTCADNLIALVERFIESKGRGESS
jgi:hypothetical protein